MNMQGSNAVGEAMPAIAGVDAVAALIEIIRSRLVGSGLRRSSSG